MKWLKGRLGRGGGKDAAAAERILWLERELQAAKLELGEKDRAIATLRGELEQQRRGEATRLQTALRARTEHLLTEAAAPAAQLQTQAHLLETERRSVPAKDVLTVARRLIRVLEDEGLKWEGEVGEHAPFNPGHHEPLNAAAALTAGQPVIVRFAGVTCQGKLLRKAGVENAAT
jgi:molecular chaperone GrpE (heat shock protein)